jgi:hypothetical protein
MQHAASQEHDSITCLLSGNDSVSHRRRTGYEVEVQATNTSTTQPINRVPQTQAIATTTTATAITTLN